MMSVTHKHPPALRAPLLNKEGSDKKLLPYEGEVIRLSGGRGITCI